MESTALTLLTEPVQPELAEEVWRFRRPHLAQVASVVVATGLIIASLVAIIMTQGWTLYVLLVAIAEMLLLMAHGVPLVVRAAQTLVISEEGIRSTGLFRDGVVEWWEVQRVAVEEDLSRFRAEGVRSRLTCETSAFPPNTRLCIYRAIRAHLARRQKDLEPWLHKRRRVYRFSTSAALSLGALLLATIATILLGPEPFGTLVPGNNVLGLRCAYASKYLREKYGLPSRQGCVVLRVTEDGAAEAAGLAEGQLIVALEGVPVTSGPQFSVFFYSLDKRRQEYTVLRPGEEEPLTTRVILGPPGRLPEYDSEDPYFFYLRARGADDRGQAILDLGRAIELAPDFDLAYVYRAALHVETLVLDDALTDLNHALKLDPDNAEAYRWRAEAYRSQGDYEGALADTETAIRLNGCSEGFRAHNYDCHVLHSLRANIFGARAGPGYAETAVSEAEAAVEFYPELPNAYYLAAYYLSLSGREEEAREYARRFLERSENYEVRDSDVEWARRLVSGSAFPDEPPAPAGEPARLFVNVSHDRDIVADGDPVVTPPRFAEERDFWRTPVYVPALGSERPQIWAYFQFDNAAAVRTIRWEWQQNLAVTDFGKEPWPGTNKGHAWLVLDNGLIGENSQSSLTILFDGEPVATGDVSLLGGTFLAPATFCTDAAGTEPILFYSGDPNPLYAALDYAGVLPGSTLPWVAQQNGAHIAQGDIVFEGEEGRAVVPIDLPPDLRPGLIEIYFYLRDKPARTAWLVLAPPEATHPPPFERLEIGMEPDREGHLALATKVFPAGVGQIAYVLDGVKFGPESELSIQWYRDGTPVWPWPDTWKGSEGFPGANLSFGEDLEPGEYQVLVSWDGVPVYADVVVVD